MCTINTPLYCNTITDNHSYILWYYTLSIPRYVLLSQLHCLCPVLALRCVKCTATWDAYSSCSFFNGIGPCDEAAVETVAFNVPVVWGLGFFRPISTRLHQVFFSASQDNRDRIHLFKLKLWLVMSYIIPVFLARGVLSLGCTSRYLNVLHGLWSVQCEVVERSGKS